MIANLARHLAAGGVLIAGFQLSPGRLTLSAYDRCCETAGLALQERYATWDAGPWLGQGSYAVSVHRKVS